MISCVFLMGLLPAKSGAHFVQEFLIYDVHQDTPELHDIFKELEKKEKIRIRWKSFASEEALLRGLRTTKIRPHLVLGISNFHHKRALRDFATLPVYLMSKHPNLKDNHAMAKLSPYAWGEVALIYDARSFQIPKSTEITLDNLPQILSAGGGGKLIVQDPRTSLTGKMFAWWIYEQKKTQATHYWRMLRPNIHRVALEDESARKLFLEEAGAVMIGWDRMLSNANDVHVQPFIKTVPLNIPAASFSLAIMKGLSPDLQKKAEKIARWLQTKEAQQQVAQILWVKPKKPHVSLKKTYAFPKIERRRRNALPDFSFWHPYTHREWAKPPVAPFLEAMITP